MTDQLTLLPEDTLVSHLALPGSEKARKMTAICGQLCLSSSKSTGPLGLLEKTLLATSIWGSTMCFLTWGVRHTKLGHLLFQLVPCRLRIDVTECGLLPTPNSQGGGVVRRQTRRETGSQEHTQTQLYHYGMLPTMGANEMKGTSKKRFLGSPHFRGAKTSEALRTTLDDPIYLNPSFAEIMMGYPLDYTLLEIQSSPKSPK